MDDGEDLSEEDLYERLSKSIDALKGIPEDDELDSFTDEDLEKLLAAVIEDIPDTFLDPPVAGKRKRMRRQRVDLWASEWGRLLTHHKTSTPGTFEYIKFRLRFRVPFPLFKKLIPAVKAAHIFNKSRSSYIPLEFKVMIALRIIGRDTDCDTASELSCVPKSTCNAIVKQSCLGFADHFDDNIVYIPKDTELSKIMSVFGRVGFPGAMGSMDVTHFRWLACPKESYNYCKGKYPFPTLACQAIVDHNRRILFLSGLYDGRENDKNITADDAFTYDVMMGLFNDVKYKLYDKDGVLRICQGGYIIVDGGYQDISCFVDPLHSANGHKEVHNDNKRHDVDLKNGLFCSMLLPSTKSGLKLAEFKGVIITERHRQELGIEGGYVLKTHKGLLNCYDNAMRGLCKASMANSAIHCFNKSGNRNAVNNCTIRVNGNTVTLYTAKNIAIPPNRELLWAYQSAYQYPALPMMPHDDT